MTVLVVKYIMRPMIKNVNEIHLNICHCSRSSLESVRFFFKNLLILFNMDTLNLYIYIYICPFNHKVLFQSYCSAPQNSIWTGMRFEPRGTTNPPNSPQIPLKCAFAFCPCPSGGLCMPLFLAPKSAYYNGVSYIKQTPHLNVITAVAIQVTQGLNIKQAVYFICYHYEY